MELFLQQYGLKWQGYEESKKSDSFQPEKIKKDVQAISNPKYKYNVPKEIDINIILRRVDELNLIMDKDGRDEVFKDKDGIHRWRDR